jgi:hypothetical protein
MVRSVRFGLVVLLACTITGSMLVGGVVSPGVAARPPKTTSVPGPAALAVLRSRDRAARAHGRNQAGSL